MKIYPTKAIGQLCKLINGRAFKPSDWGKEGLPIVRIQNLNDHSKAFNNYQGPYSENHFIDSGTILLSWSGTPGTSFGCFLWNRGPALLNQHIFKVIVNNDLIDGDFFIYAVNSRLDEMIHQAHGGVGLRHITKRKLEEIYIPFPEINEQRRIVASIKECFDRLDEIENLRNESIFENSMLIESFIENELKNIDGEYVNLHDVCSITSKLVDPRKNEYKNMIHVGGANIESKTGILLNLKSANEENIISGKFVFNESTVLYNKIRPYLMKVARPNFSGLCSADMYPLSVNSKIFTRDYLYYLLISKNFTEHAIAGSNRAGMPKVNRSHLFKYRFKLPSISQQKCITKKLDFAVTSLNELGKEVMETGKEMPKLRDSILRKAFAGEL